MPEYKGEIIGMVKEDVDKFGNARVNISIFPDGRLSLLRKLQSGAGYLNISTYVSQGGKKLIKMEDDGDKALGGVYSQPPPPPQQQAARFSREDARPPEPPELDLETETDIPF